MSLGTQKEEEGIHACRGKECLCKVLPWIPLGFGIGTVMMRWVGAERGKSRTEQDKQGGCLSSWVCSCHEVAQSKCLPKSILQSSQPWSRRLYCGKYERRKKQLLHEFLLWFDGKKGLESLGKWMCDQESSQEEFRSLCRLLVGLSWKFCSHSGYRYGSHLDMGQLKRYREELQMCWEGWRKLEQMCFSLRYCIYTLWKFISWRERTRYQTITFQAWWLAEVITEIMPARKTSAFKM